MKREVGDHTNPPATGQSVKRTPLTQPPSPSTKKSKKSAAAQDADMAAQLAQRAESSRQLQEKIENLLESADDAKLSRRGWGQWIAGMMSYMEEDVMQSFYDQSYSLVMSHVRRSAQQKEQRKRQTTQQQQFQTIQTTQQQQYYQPISGQPMDQPSTYSAGQVRGQWDTVGPSAPSAVRSTPRESTESLGLGSASFTSFLGQLGDGDGRVN